MAKLSQGDRQKLPRLLEELAGAVEELLLSGLTTASDTTRQTLNIAVQEASRLGLSRLGGTLRMANDELGRFTQNKTEFSPARLHFFLNRSWLLSKALTRALANDNEEEFDKLTLTPSAQIINHLEVVTLGVLKKVVSNAFCSYEFRMRSVCANETLAAGQRLVWSCMFPMKGDVQPEMYLHLAQKQKFKAVVFSENKVLKLDNVSLSMDASGGGRVSLRDESIISPEAEFSNWQQFMQWDASAALARLRQHRPGPFDLEIEMQEEVVLTDWQVGEPSKEGEHAPTVFPIISNGVVFHASVSANIEGKPLLQAMETLRTQEDKPPLFGLMHYEKCRLAFQPLSLLEDKGPHHLMLSGEKISPAALLKALKF